MSPNLLIVAACLTVAVLLTIRMLLRRRRESAGAVPSGSRQGSGTSAVTAAADRERVMSPPAGGPAAPRGGFDGTGFATREVSPVIGEFKPVSTGGATSGGPTSVSAGTTRARSTVDTASLHPEGRLFGPVTPVLAALLPETESKKRMMQRELVNAGYYAPGAWQNLAAVRYLGIMLPIVLFGAMFVLLPRTWELPVLLLGVMSICLGWALPSLIVRSQADERRQEIGRAMPDMLDMLNMCVSQGMPLPRALGRVSRELQPVYPSLSRELRIVTEQGQIGSLEQALQNFSDRVQVPEVHSFTSTLIQTERMGTSISSALADHSDNIREGLRQRADQAANMATFKLLFPTALFLMPAVFLFLLGPTIVDLTDFFEGDAGDVFRDGRAAATQVLQEYGVEQ
jgi:tight adherence protein C